MKALKKKLYLAILCVVVGMAGFGAAVLLNMQTGGGNAQKSGYALAQTAQDSVAGGAHVETGRFSKRLEEAGVKTCASKIDSLGAATMGGVTNFFSASNWNIESSDAHLASVFIGQKYANPKLPFGFASLFGAPDGRGGCDGASVQVLASPVDCPTLQKNILQRGKLIGDLAGVVLLQDVASQVALVPTAANTCVIVSIHTEFAAKH
jgi:hypothetical protein